MAVNPIRKPMGDFREAYLRKAQEFLAELKRLTSSGMSEKAAVNKAWKAVNYSELVKDKLAEEMIKAVAIGGIQPAAVKLSRKNILDKWISYDGTKLSSALYKNEATARRIIINELQQQTRLGRGFKQAAQFLQDKTGQFTAEAPGYLKELSAAGRKALDPEQFKKFQKQIATAQKQVDKLSAGGNTNELKATYQNLIDAVKDGTDKAMDKAMERAVLEKARYQAERLARTEIARAYGDARLSEIQDDEDATGWQWVLSSAHSIFDICDFNATADLYGMGPGVYPLKKGPVYPSHPGCTCILRNFYKDRKPENKVDNSSAIKTLKALSEDEKKALMGKQGSELFAKNPESWKGFVNGFQHEIKKPQI